MKSSSIIKKILIITILVAAAMTLAFVRGRMLVVRGDGCLWFVIILYPAILPEG